MLKLFTNPLSKKKKFAYKTAQGKSFVCGVFPCYESLLFMDGFMRNELVSGFI